MITTSPLMNLQAGALALGVATGMVACGSTLGGHEGGDAGYAIPDSAADAFRDATHSDGGAGRCSAINFDPPAALRFRAYDVRYGGAGTSIPQTTMPFGGVFINSDLILPVTPDSPDASDAATPMFVGLLQLGSMPLELPSTDDRVRRRVNGDPLATFGRPGVPNWDQAFPGVQNIGLAYTVSGHFDRQACTLSLRLSGAVNGPSGLMTDQPLLALPFYAPRADGRYDMAAPDFSNEAVAVFQGGLSFTLNLGTSVGDPALESALTVVCDNNNCPTIAGSGVRRLEVVLIRRLVGSTDAGLQDAQAESGADAAPVDAGHDAPSDAAVDARPDASSLDAGDASRDVGTSG
jgi:hypothetical protein